MFATPSWLRRFTAPWLKKPRAGRPHATRALGLDQLEYRAYPGSGITPLGALSDWVTANAMQARPKITASPSVTSAQVKAKASASIRDRPAQSISTRIAPMTTELLAER